MDRWSTQATTCICTFMAGRPLSLASCTPASFSSLLRCPRLHSDVYSRQARVSVACHTLQCAAAIRWACCRRIDPVTQGHFGARRAARSASRAFLRLPPLSLSMEHSAALAGFCAVVSHATFI